MTTFPCDYCGGKDMEIEPWDATEFHMLYLQLGVPELEHLSISICPWCLKKVFDTVLKPKKEKK